MLKNGYNNYSLKYCNLKLRDDGEGDQSETNFYSWGQNIDMS